MLLATSNAPREATPRRVVFDTNALLSLWAFTDSRFAPLRAEVEAGRWRAYTTSACLEEFHRVLAYPQFGFTAERQQAAYAAYLASACLWDQLADAPMVLPRCRDKDDQKFLELARDVAAEWLVTSDKALLKMARRDKLRGLFYILKPEALLLTLQAAA